MINIVIEIISFYEGILKSNLYRRGNRWTYNLGFLAVSSWYNYFVH